MFYKEQSKEKVRVLGHVQIRREESELSSVAWAMVRDEGGLVIGSAELSISIFGKKDSSTKKDQTGLKSRSIMKINEGKASGLVEMKKITESLENINRSIEAFQKERKTGGASGRLEEKENEIENFAILMKLRKIIKDDHQ